MSGAQQMAPRKNFFIFFYDPKYCDGVVNVSPPPRPGRAR